MASSSFVVRVSRPWAILLLAISFVAALAVVAGAHGGDASLIHGCVKTAGRGAGSLIIIDANASCPSGHNPLDWAIQGPQGEQGPPGPAGPIEELIVIQRHEFDTTEPYFDTTIDWEVIVSGGADLFFDPSNSLITMDTEQSPFTAGSVVVRGRRSASLNDGALVFKTRMTDAYAESCCVYGDAQPRGLANGTDRNNAIEFINVVAPGAQGVGCRTVADGTATQTNVDIGQWVRRPAVYQIVAKPTEVKFYVNGTLFCTHTTNIPTAPLNIYYGTGDSGAGNVPVGIDWVSFERRAA